MRNIFKLGFFALLFSVGACSDATDIIQESELDETAAFQTVADLSSGLNGVYAAYAPDAGGNGNGDAIFFNDLFTDNIKKGLASSGQGASEYAFILQPSNSSPESIWANRYGTINRINRVLRAYDRIYPTLEDGDLTGTDEDKAGADLIKGQLLALRALCHLDLFEYFTPDYNNGAGLSVIKMDFVPELTDVFERNTVDEIVAFINDDITQAYALLGDDFAVDAAGLNPWNYISTNAVKAIEARLAIDTGDNARAETLAGQLSGLPNLADPTAYQAMFNDTQQGEIIFSLARNPNTGDNGIANNWYANRVNRSGSPILEASKQLLNLFALTDVRRVVTFVPEGEPDGSDFDAPNNNGIILIGKYPGAASDFLVNDIKIFRSSEMQLILAEAQARNGNLAGAAASIQALRTIRVDPTATPAAYASLPAALTDILLERRKELAFEGHRYLDLKRLGTELGIGISRLPGDAATFSAPENLEAGSYKLTMPIPQSELNANSIITQNPGYSLN